MSRFSFKRISYFVVLATLAPLTTHAQTRGLGFDTTQFDKSVRPQDDLFRYVNGAWLRSTQIPPDESSWGSFQELRDRARENLRGLFEEARKAPAGSEARKVGDLYASYMDTVAIDRAGLGSLEGELHTIHEIEHASDLPKAFAHFARLGVGGPVGAFIGADPKRSDVNILSVGQGGLGMPDRDYYLRDDAKMQATRKAYTDYITRLLTLAKQPDPAGAAQRILSLETAIASRQWDRGRLRDRNATYNKMTTAEMAALTPSFSWPKFLEAAGMSKMADVIVRQPDYLKAMDSIYAATPVSTWREWLTFKLLDNYATVLPSAYNTARFEFRSKTLLGVEQPLPRWKRAVDATSSTLGDAAGKLYVAKYFKPAAKARMDSLVRNLIEAYRVGIDSLAWMSPETKAAAKEKLSHFTVKIGYPDHPRDYSALVIKPDDLLGNAIRADEFQYNDMLSRIGKPVDRTRWGMTAPTVNAQYSPTNNDITFPAGILQPPFFNVEADDATNYGAIGAVIGHEIGHGFDDQGRKSDGSGNLRDWWTAADAQAFEALASKFGAQYDAINPIDNLHINSKLTMGENIGDLSGLAQAYRAYRISLHGKEPPVIGGFTGDQRFFIGYAQIWRTKMRDDALRNQLLTNPHSPGMYRAFVPIVNNDVFQNAFHTKPGDKMYLPPEARVRIW